MFDGDTVKGLYWKGCKDISKDSSCPITIEAHGSAIDRAARIVLDPARYGKIQAESGQVRKG
jgi:hypothetical protein